MDLNREMVEEKISRAPNDIERVDLINYYCFKMLLFDIDYCEELQKRAFVLAKKLGYSRGLAASGVSKGCCLIERSKYDEAIGYLEEGCRYFENPLDKDRRAYISAINGLGVVYLQKGDYAKSTEYLRQTLNMSDQMGDYEFLGTVYDDLSILNFRLNHKKKALEYSYKALELLKKSSNIGAYVLACNNAADYLYKFEEYEKALTYLEEALKLAREHQLKNCLSTVFNTIGEVYEAMGDYNKALENYREGLKEAKKDKSETQIIQLLEYLGSLFLKQNKLKKAGKFLKKSFKKARKMELLTAERIACGLLITLWEKKKSYKKAQWYQKHLAVLMKKIYDLDVTMKVRNIETDSLKKSNQRLKVISAIGSKITSVLNIKEVMNIIYASIDSLMDSPVCGIARYDKGLGKICYDMFIEEGTYLKPIVRDINTRASLAGYSIKNRQDIIINDIEKEYGKYNLPGPVPFSSDDKPVRSMIFTPLTVGEEVVGILTIQSYKTNAYSLADLDSLKILSSYIVTALNNARQLEKEMEVAKQIQTAILPRNFLNDNFDIYGLMQPADHVGGDYFDFLLDKKNNEWFCIGDVTNHGLTPGLIMMMTQSVIKTIIETNTTEPATEKVINKLNEVLYDTIRNRLNIDEAMTISVFCHLGDGKIVTSGLHEDVLIYRKKTGTVEIIHTRGMWIGFIPSIEGITKTDEFFLYPGDVMLLYTDGLIEARNEKKELMKLQRIIDLFRQNGEKNPEEIAHTLLQSVQEFMARQADDITVLVVKKR